MSIPRRLFMYWADGFDNAPPMVQLAVESWHRLNPDLEVILLSDSTLDSWISTGGQMSRFFGLDVQKQSDLIRLAILSEHGGFWSDATVFCQRSLNQWIDFAPKSRVVFLRTRPGKNRWLQTFFLGGPAGSPFLLKWRHELERALACGAIQMTTATKKRWQRRRPALWSNPAVTSIWSVPAVIRRTGYPYLLPHYVANRMILTSPLSAARFLATPDYRAGEALHFQALDRGFELFREEFESRSFPLWKFTWRTEINTGFWDQVFGTASNFLTEVR